MHAFLNIFPVSAVQKLLKSVKIWQSCNQMYTPTFYEPQQKCRFWFFQVRCANKSGDVKNCIIVTCRISSRLKWYKNYKNRLRLAKVIVKNKMSHFLWFTVYITTHMHITRTLLYPAPITYSLHHAVCGEVPLCLASNLMTVFSNHSAYKAVARVFPSVDALIG